MKIFYCFFLFSLFSFLFSPPVSAAELRLELGNREIGMDDDVRVSVFLSSDESINAVESTLLFPPDFLELAEIRDGNSFIPFWIASPSSPASGSIRFAGIIPGGLTGQNRYLFSAVFRAKQPGIADIRFDQPRVLLNDGLATSAPLTVRNEPLVISEGTRGQRTPIERDTEKPETFRPQLVQYPDFFNGAWMLIFQTQDKSSGILSYSVKESPFRFLTFFSPWEKAESPYRLRDQSRSSYLFIRATDRAGNDRTVVMTPHKMIRWYTALEIGIVIMTLFSIASAGYVWRKFRKKKREKRK